MNQAHVPTLRLQAIQILHFKSHVLSYLEYRTPAIYHCTETCLLPLERFFNGFLRQLNLTREEALIHFNLAPLSTRRDIAMMGVIQRAVLRQGPESLRQHFVLHNGTSRFLRRRHRYHLRDWNGNIAVIRRSVLGLTSVYNMLQDHIVASPTISEFQTGLQDLVKYLCAHGCRYWCDGLSPRVATVDHPLLILRRRVECFVCIMHCTVLVR